MAGMSGMGGGMGGAGMGGGMGGAGMGGGMGGAGGQAQWMMTGPVIQRQVTEMCQNLMKVRNGYREMRDHLPFFVNPPEKAKKRFIDITETLYGYLTSLRRNYARDDSDSKSKQIVEYYETKLAGINQQLADEKKAKENAMTRISELSSRLLKSGSSDVTELSDPYRPMKLAEELNCVYDNEWTDCYEFFTEEKNMKDDEAIDLLFAMIQKCHELCQEAARKQYNQLEDVATTPTLLLPRQAQAPDPKEKVAAAKGGKKGGKESNKKSSAEELEAATDEFEPTTKIEPYIKEFRKVVAAEATKTAVAEIMTVFKQSKIVSEDLLANTVINQYLQQCAKICWLMVTQYPPLVLKIDVKPGDKFNTEIFREYRTKGQKIVRPVWPPIYLHANGPLISKGFADGDGKK